MTRHWGLPSKNARTAFLDAQTRKPIMTLFVTAIFGVIGAALAAVSFAEARGAIAGLFRGGTLIGAVLAAGFGCWFYVWMARPRFAAQLSGAGDGFSSLLRFYARAALALMAAFILARVIGAVTPGATGVWMLCAIGGASAAAAFQTVLAFVPHYE